ncbi:MAG: alpha/beta fold hydrolase [Rhodothermales bacterium]|nr:alpha/beta fold hydrolase [Rhodothermales bacterium]
MKWIVRIAVGLAALLVLAALGVAFLPVSPFVPASRDLADETQFDLEEKVGWYRLEDGSLRLLTWADERGLVLYRFGSNRDDLGRSAFLPVTPDLLASASGPNERRLEFVRGSNAVIIKANLTTPDGVQSMVPVTGPYETREVRFGSDAAQLAGLLLLPAGAGPHPAVAFIHGSGTSSRDRFWYLTPADYLAREGIAVLLPDKRGSGKSGGEWHTSSFGELATDAVDAVDFLVEQASVDRVRVGLAGFSQGGWVAPLAAAQSAEIAFLITISGSVATPSEQITYEVSREIRNGGAPGLVARTMAPLFARRAKMRLKSWWKLNGSFDPIPYWRDLGRPSLMFFGEADQNVDVSRSLGLLADAELTAREGFSTVVFPTLGHGLIREDTGWLEPEYLRSMGQFILSK